MLDRFHLERYLNEAVNKVLKLEAAERKAQGQSAGQDQLRLAVSFREPA